MDFQFVLFLGVVRPPERAAPVTGLPYLEE